MVHYIITPWRHRQELLNVRQALYGSAAPSSEEKQRKAVALVSIWVQRGNCPHLVESTALIIAAILNENSGASAYAMRAAYSTAICRFVTGLLDGYQDKKHKMSMYSIAKSIGLPSTFVEIRHQCTHEELPSLTKLRAAAQKSLSWIWGHYWKGLEEPAIAQDDPVDLVLDFLTGRPHQTVDDERSLMAKLQALDADQLQDALLEITNSTTTSTKVLLQAVRVSEDLMSAGKEEALAKFKLARAGPRAQDRSLQGIRAELEEAKRVMENEEAGASKGVAPEPDMEDAASDNEGGWCRWKGPWTPKPIGVV